MRSMKQKMEEKKKVERENRWLAGILVVLTFVSLLVFGTPLGSKLPVIVKICLAGVWLVSLVVVLFASIIEEDIK